MTEKTKEILEKLGIKTPGQDGVLPVKKIKRFFKIKKTDIKEKDIEYLINNKNERQISN